MFKSYSLRIIRELLIHHTNLFMNYIELTIFRILKAQSETESEVSDKFQTKTTVEMICFFKFYLDNSFSGTSSACSC